MSRRTPMMTLVAVACCLSLTVPAIAAQDPPSRNNAVPMPNAAATPNADADGDGLSQALEARLQGSDPAEKLEVIVTWSGPPNLAAAQAAAGPFAVLEEYSIIDGFLASVSPGQARALARVPGVFRIDENFEVQATNFETDQEYGTERARIEFGVDGTGVDVCVLDTGADPNHEQLDSNIVGFFDSINGRTVPYDDQGHGTHVAATIGGDGVGDSANAAKNQGIAPAVDLYIAKVLSSSGSGTADQIIDGIEWCVSEGADIMSASLGTATGSDGLDALSQAVNNAVVDHGIVATIAAGNSGDAPETVGSPGAAAHALTVGAVGKMKDGLVLAPFYSRGPNLAGVLKPEVVSPGVLVVSADAGTTSGYVAGTGTSMATPFTAGAVALLLQANSLLTPAEVKGLVTTTARDIGVSGADNDSGFGLIDGYGLLSEARGGSESGSLPTHTRVSGTVADNGLWSHQVEISGDDIGQPIGITALIEGTLQCSSWFFGICLGYEWSPDLDARLIAPDDTVVDSRCPLEGWCGSAGVQETFRVASALEGTYTLEIYPYSGSPNNGKGGSFGVDIFTGTLGDATANQPPVADAGPDQTVVDSDGVAGETVTLDGSESSDPDGTIVTYSWTTEDGSVNATGVNPDVEVGDGTHTITLTVTDDEGATDSDTVSIAVEAPADSNQPPVANAGPDQTMVDSDGVAGETVTLDGSESSDPDGTIVTYSWTTEDGSVNATGVNPDVEVGDGTHTITLTVTDDEGATDSDTVSITVEPPPADPGHIHVHDLDGSSEKLPRGAWKALVDVAVRDSGESTVTGFGVTGTFSQGSWSESFTCTDGGAGDTDGAVNGVCRFDSGQLPGKDGKATFTVTGVTLDGYTYDSSANHDPDGDNDGTTIQLSK